MPRAESERLERAEQASKDRRRRYHQGRVEVKRIAERGSLIEPSRMTDDALWIVLTESLAQNEREALDGSNAGRASLAMKMVDLAREIRLRGSQLEFPM